MKAFTVTNRDRQEDRQTEMAGGGVKDFSRSSFKPTLVQSGQDLSHFCVRIARANILVHVR